jgi:rhodanese-related sulfurtransferase
MKQINILKYLLIVLLLFTFDCTDSQVKEVPEISVEELSVQMRSNDSLLILDVRTEAELAGPLGQIDGVFNIPIDELEERINELNEYKEYDIAVICRSGRRSERGTNILNENGFNAKNVVGGMQEYRKMGY